MRESLPGTTFVPATSEFYPLVRGASRRGISSRNLDWKGFVLERHDLEPSHLPETVSNHYILSLWITAGSGQSKNERGLYTRYTKSPGTLTFAPPGVVPAVTSETRIELLCCSLEASLVEKIKESLALQPVEEAYYRTGFTDLSLKQIMLLLANEIDQEGISGPLYATHLVDALTIRLLHLQEHSGVQHEQAEASPLPTPALRRVLQRMETLSPSLDLQTLADESGYSRRHFVRMFVRATGYTPHHYLLNLRIERAENLLKKRSVPLADIAMECGFASQSHMTMAFRKIMGTTPGSYRRQVRD